MHQYTKIIDHILKTSDLATVSRKKVRKGLELELDKDLSDKKVQCLHVFSPGWRLPCTDPFDLPQDAIKTLIEQRFDAIAETQPTEAMPTPPHHTNGTEGRTNGVKHDEEDAYAEPDDDAASNEIQVSTVPSKKRSSSMVEDEDARLAAQLQAQENQLARGRQTRGGHSAPKQKVKAKKKSKSSAKVKAGDDSDLDTEDSGTVKKRKAGGGFQKEFNLSYSLADLVGAEKVRVASHKAHIRQWCLELTLLNRCHDRRSSRSCGSTSRPTTCKSRRTSARYVVTSGCKQSSSRTRSTCSR